jgi:putative NIF3 family GTP cyclohydrolase 1 type 2
MQQTNGQQTNGQHMTVTDLDRYLRSILPLDEFTRIDSSRNGLQVDRRNQTVRRVAFAVDAAYDVFEAAAAWSADVLFVHHGLFWGREEVLTGPHYRRVAYMLEHDLALYAVHLPFGPREIRSVGLISGGAPLEVDQAIDQGLDLYISGDANHIAYHRCREAGINAIFGGHYATEVWGVQRVAAKLAADTGLETTFLDIPTGM